MTLNAESRKGSPLAVTSVSCLLFAIIIIEIIALILWIPGVWSAKLSAVFAVIGVYALTIKFVSSASVFKESPEILTDDFVSPNPVVYISASFRFLGFIFELLGNGLSKQRKVGYSPILWWIGMMTVLIVLPIIIVYPIIHIFIVLPVSYIPVLVVSALVQLVESSNKDSIVTIHLEKDKKDVEFLLSRLITDDMIGSKMLLIGIPSIAFSVFSSVAGLLIG
jgi:hypothetical protein